MPKGKKRQDNGMPMMGGKMGKDMGKHVMPGGKTMKDKDMMMPTLSAPKSTKKGGK